jgi:hypothetical protein
MKTPWQIRDKDAFIKELCECIRDLSEAGYDHRSDGAHAYPQFHAAVKKHATIISDAEEVCAPPKEEYDDGRDYSGHYEP